MLYESFPQNFVKHKSNGILVYSTKNNTTTKHEMFYLNNTNMSLF